MGWVRLDDEFEDHPKVAPLSDAAHRMWTRAACWCRKPKNAHTNGFVPRVQLEAIARKPMRTALKIAKELVDADGGGMFEHGLWEAREDGWQFHDWDDYQPRNLTPEEETELSAKRAEAGRKGAQARWAKHGKGDGKPDGNLPSKPRQTHGPPLAKKCPPSPSQIGREILTDDGDPDLSGQSTGKTSSPPPVPGEDRESPCDPRLALPLEVATELAAKTGFSLPVIRAAESEFVSYWTIGGGMGKRRRNWMARLRQDLLVKADSGKLDEIAARIASPRRGARATDPQARIDALFEDARKAREEAERGAHDETA